VNLATNARIFSSRNYTDVHRLTGNIPACMAFLSDAGFVSWYVSPLGPDGSMHNADSLAANARIVSSRNYTDVHTLTRNIPACVASLSAVFSEEKNLARKIRARVAGQTRLVPNCFQRHIE
jgi:hypothetical protein